MQSLISVNLNEEGFANICAVKTISQHSCAVCMELNLNFVSVIPKLLDDLTDRIKQVLIYVAGYVQRRISDETECSDTYEEYEKYRHYLDTVNRGGLVIPEDSVVYFVYYSYIAFTCLSTNAVPCYTATYRCCKAVCSEYKLLYAYNQRIAARTMSNILLNNFTKRFEAPSGNEPKIKVAKLSNAT